MECHQTHHYLRLCHCSHSSSFLFGRCPRHVAVHFLDNPHIGSQHYVKQKLDTLDTKQLDSVREVLLKNPQPRLKKEVTSSRHMPYGVTADYIKFVEAADSEKLAKLIKTVALLLQTKVYLFWSKSVEIRIENIFL